ncbi:MAG: hypothetical protein HC938_09825 [Nitrospira sp.]|nr:hypothetical protein [Nitrospira sp.]
MKDALTTPNQQVSIEAKLVGKGLMASVALGGEPLDLLVDGKVVASAMTGGDGRAFLTYTPTAKGINPVHVRVGKSPRVDHAEGQAHLAVWETRQPILMIELSSLMEIPPPSRVPAIGFGSESAQKPMSEAADELEKLTRFLLWPHLCRTRAVRGRQLSGEYGGWGVAPAAQVPTRLRDAPLR